MPNPLQRYLKQIPTFVWIIVVLAGCAALSEGPKHIWSQRIRARAASNQRICIGTIRTAEINPVTWLIAGTSRHYFVHPDEVIKVDWGFQGAWLGGAAADLVTSLPNPNNTYLVNVVMADKDDGQTLYTGLFDTKTKRYAYIGSDASSKDDIQKRLQKPDWEEVSKYEWFRNIHDWLAAGRPTAANYCN